MSQAHRQHHSKRAARKHAEMNVALTLVRLSSGICYRDGLKVRNSFTYSNNAYGEQLLKFCTRPERNVAADHNNEKMMFFLSICRQVFPAGPKQRNVLS
jgi:hypothetical protein